MAATVSFGSPGARSICSIFPLCIESNALEKSTNNIVASSFFALTPSIIRRIANNDRNRSTTSQILTIRRILESILAKNLGNNIICRLYEGF